MPPKRKQVARRLSKTGLEPTPRPPKEVGRHTPSGRPIEVTGPDGSTVFSGIGRRAYREVAFFDSDSNSRRFHVPGNRLSPERIEALKAYARIHGIPFEVVVAGMKTYPDQRNPKHKKRHLDEK